MSNRKELYYMLSITIMIFLTVVFAVTFSYVGRANVTRNTNTNIAILGNASFSYTGVTTLSLNVTEANLASDNAANNYSKYVRSSARNTNINLTIDPTQFDYGLSCYYDIVYTPTVAFEKSPAAVTANLKELTIRGWLDGTQKFETEINGENEIVLYSGSISVTQLTPSLLQKWQFRAYFYNLDVDQNSAAGQNPRGTISIRNGNCGGGLAEYLANNAPKSGTDAVSNSPWMLTSDRSGEWRYAGKNPDNYLSFNDELWRIIGVFPNMEYCTGQYGATNECSTSATGSLVKIIRNASIGSPYFDAKASGVGSSSDATGSNDWSDSQLMLMLNGKNYLKTAYDADATQLHTGYTIASNVVKDANGYSFYNVKYSYIDGSGTTVYVPSQATTSSYTATSATVPKKIASSYLNKVATVKWFLYGPTSYMISPEVYYNVERNIGGVGSVYSVASGREKRPIYWYGKIGLMYPSDYGYATYGNGSSSGNYSRTDCLTNRPMNGWGNSDTGTYCANNSWLLYANVTSSFSGTAVNQYTITPAVKTSEDHSFFEIFNGSMGYAGTNSNWNVRPTLYLTISTRLTGGSGTWNDPYTIS